MIIQKATNYSIPLLAIMLISACQFTKGSDVSVSGLGETIAGHYTYGHEVNSFRPCNNKKEYWVNGADELLETMVEKYNGLSVQPYDEVFVELVASFQDKAADGFAMDYDGQINLIRLVSIKIKSDTDCI